jgi:hypothetical protein
VLASKFTFIFILLWSQMSLAQDLNKFKYDQNKTLKHNELSFLKTTAQDCENFGYKRAGSDLTPQAVLETYPKEISFLFFKKHIHTLCYYAVSHISKTITDDFKSQVEQVVLNEVDKCFFLGKIKKPKLCDDLKTKAALFDLTILLGHFCTKDSLRVFKAANCEFKKVGERECALYQDSSKPLARCPFAFANQREANDLYKSYYSKTCKRPKWRKPKCLN